MNRIEAAMLLAGVTSGESKQASAPTNVHLISGEVSGVSEDGIAKVAIDGLVFSEADDQYIEMDTLGGLEDGDVVTIMLSGEPGGGMTPLAIGGSGTIDRISLRVKNIEADYVKTDELEANYAHISEGVIDNATIGHADVDGLSAAYAQIDGANITTATIRESWINKVMVQSGLIAQEGTVYTLDALQVNAENITAGTIDVERLIVTVNGEKYMVHIDPTTSSPTYEKLDGNIIEDLTITADKIVAGTITADKITTNNLVGTGGWINLRNGTFAYVNSTTGEGISWDGSHLSIGGASQLGNSTVNDIIDDIAEVADAVDNISVGGRNWLLDTGTFDNWYRSSAVTASDGITTFPSRSSLSWICTRRLTIPAADFFGNTWTFSFDYRSDDFSDTSGHRYIDVNIEAGATYSTSTRTKYRQLNSSSVSGAANTWVPTTEWQRGTLTFTVADESFLTSGSGDVDYVGITVWSYTLNSFQVRKLKLEKGNKATDWTAAPEDVTAYTDDAINSIEVGGRNLLPNSQDWSGAAKRTNGTIVITSDTYGGCSVLTHVWGSGNSDVGYQGNVWTQPIEADAWYTLSFWAKASSVIESTSYFFSSNVVDKGINSSGQTTTSTDGTIKNTITTEWQRIWVSWHIKADATSFPQQLIVARLQTQHSGVTLYLAGPKLEKGNKATDWSPAPEDIKAYADESAYLNAKPNIAPLGSVEFSDVYNATTNPNGYWRTTIGAWYTRLDDGWIHVYVDNSTGTGAVNNTSFRPSSSPTVVAGKVYTILTEIRNNVSTGTGTNDFYLQQISNNQFWGNTSGVVIDDYHVTTTTTVSLLTCGQSYALRSYRIADTNHLTAGTPSPEMFRYNFRAAKGSVLNFDFRMSVYEGIYDGPYKPYSGTQLFATQTDASNAAKTATNYITADLTGIKIHMSDSPTTYQHQSSTATTYYVNGNKRAEVSADGLEVFDGTPGYEESVAAFGTVARLGKANGNKVIADPTGVHIYNVISISDEQGPQVAQVAEFGQAPGESTTTIISDEPEIGTNYPVPSDAISIISIMLDGQELAKDTDYTLSSGIVTLLESTTVTSILDDSGSSGEEGSEDVEAHSLTCKYSASAGVGLAIGASVTRPGLDVAERAIFRHPSFVEASHSTANADTGFRAVRNDTGIQVFCGIGIGGVNHGVYSQTLKRWLINADTSAVHVAPHTVTDGNINIKSKWVYATTPSASKGNGWGHGLQFLDTAGALVGVVKAYSLTTGEKGIQLQATRNVNSTTYNNGIRFGVDTSGNLKLAFSGGGRLLWRQALGFDSGYVSASYGGSDNAPKNAYRDIPITFNFTHTYAPHVVVTFATGSTGVTMGGLSLSAFNVTYTGCTVRIYNNTNDARNPPLYWVAID